MSQFDDPEWMENYREVIRGELLKFQKGETTGVPYQVAEEYFPGHIERQLDLCVSIGEAIGRAQELGYPEGHVPVDLQLQIAKKYGVEKVFDVEIIKLRSDGPAGIINKEWIE